VSIEAEDSVVKICKQEMNSESRPRRISVCSTDLHSVEISIGAIITRSYELCA
jgi:transcription elongation factor